VNYKTFVLQIFERYKGSIRLLSKLFIFIAFSVCNLKSYSQSAVVSSYFNANSFKDEWTELLVITDNLNMQGWTLGDNNGTQTAWMPVITFVNPASNPTFWNHLRAGTIIIVWHRQFDSQVPAVTHAQDVNANDGYLELWADDPNYFSGGDFTGNTTLNISNSGDIVQLKNSSGVHVHALGHMNAPGASYTALPVPKLNHQIANLLANNAVFVVPGLDLTYYGSLPPQSGTTYTSFAVAPTITRGLPNFNATWPTENSNFWRLTREPLWAAPVLTAVTQAVNTQVLLNWTALTDPYPTDNTTGYMILSNSVNSFGTPKDGLTYLTGDMVGGAVVLAMIPSSQPPTYTYNITIPCGTSMFYRVYAYRYTTDNANGNDYDLARGRAYNTVTFGSTQIDILSDLVISNVQPTDATCGMINGTITITSTTTATPMQYSIDNGATYQLSNFFNGLAPGSYTIRVKDNNGCETAYGSNPVIIGIVPGVTNIVVSVANATCSQNNGSITITPTGGALPLLYSIDNGVTYVASNVFNGLATGSYIVKVKDNNNCETAYGANPVIINNVGGVTAISATPTNAICGQSNGSITISATGGTAPLQYSIDNGVTFQLSNIFNGLLSGNYTVVVKDASNCITPYPTNPVIVGNTGGATVNTVDVTDATCGLTNGSITVNAIGGTAPLQYSIDGGTNWQTAILFSSLAAGSYTVIVNDANNCQTPYSGNPVVVGSTGGAAINAITATDATCGASNGSISIDAIGGTAPLQYSIDAGTNWQPSNVFSNLIAGSYTTIVSDANNCQTPYAGNPVLVGTIGGASINGVTPASASCGASNGSISIDAIGGTGPLQYSIDNGVNWQISNIFTNLPTGSYIIVVMDANNCQTPYGLNPVLVGTIGGASITSVVTQNATCGNSNGSITISTSGGTLPLQFSIDNGSTWQISNIFSSLAIGNYTVLVKDGNNCQTLYASNPVSITSIGGAIISGTIPVNATCSVNNGSITITTTGGTTPLQYSIDAGLTWQFTNTFSNLSIGNYTIIVKDANNCQTSSGVINIIDLPAPIIPTPATIDATNGQPTGSVTVVATGSTAILDYSINGGVSWQANNGTFSGLLPGNYNMTVRDANNCISSVPFIIGNTLLSIVSIQADSSKACPGSSVFISINAFGMVDFMRFAICLTYDPSVASFSGVSSVNGFLTSLITDSSIPGQLVISWVGTVLTTIPDDDLLFRIEFTGLIPGKTIIDWSNFSPGVCGVFNDSGIELIATFDPGSVTYYLAPIASIVGTPDVCEGFPVSLNAVGDTLTHQWTLPNGNISLGQHLITTSSSFADSGIYRLLTSNSLGCFGIDSLNIIIRANPLISISNQETLCAGFSTPLDPGPGYASYLWMNGEISQSITANEAMIYSVVVTDQFGCSGTDSVTVIECLDEFVVPTGFTPNRDGYNDVFRVIWNADVSPTLFKLLIYNQWGTLVYTGENIYNGWDGEFNGDPCPLGIYTYVISVEKPAGSSPALQRTVRGLVTLVR
jgi:gliding motility-associated-like protein